MGHPRRGLSGDRRAPGTPGLLPRPQRQGRPGVYYRPSTFRSLPILWEETIHADTGLLGLTSKHLYYASNRKKFRVRYDRIASFNPQGDGFGIMRDAQTAKPQTFRTGGGWFPYNLATNLSQMQG